jgi:heat shock protein HslJ
MVSDPRRLFAGALAVAILAAALPGTVAGQSTTPSAPEGIEWTIESMDAAPVTEDIVVTLSLVDGAATGSAGCNSYFGTYELDDTSLTFPEPFGSTMMMCDEAAMAVETTYLPLLSETASWAIDDTGVLSLADIDGVVQLEYREAPLEITSSDVAALVATLDDLQAQIDDATSEVTALAAQADSIDVSGFDGRLTAVEGNVEGISSRNLRSRITALEETTAQLDQTIGRFRDRIIALEAASTAQAQQIAANEQRIANQGRRITALEEASPEPTPLPAD